MVGESNRNGFLIQIDASNFTEFEISEFEISRFDCNLATSEKAKKKRRIFQILESDVPYLCLYKPPSSKLFIVTLDN